VIKQAKLGYYEAAEHHKASSSLYMHTVDTYLDTEDVASIDGEGHLILSLQKESYESCGL
jgi:hypothetical protein